MSVKIIVDQEEPEHDVQNPPFEIRTIQLRKDKSLEDQFEILDFLGRGKFGEVKRCRERLTGREFAVKFIATPRPQDRKDVEHEVNMMNKLYHKRLVQMYDAFEAKREMCLILEIIYGGELFDRVISDEFTLTERACVCIMRQVCEGVQYMHQNNIIHLDLKPENILCLSQTSNRVKIIDFGLAREFDPKKDNRVMYGTPEFMAPEVVLYDPIDFSTDMWSIGVMTYVILSGLSPFMGRDDTETLSNVSEGRYDFEPAEFRHVSKEAKNFITQLLQANKRKRLTAAQCLENEWLQKNNHNSHPSLEMTKDQLRHYVYRRKWKKAINVIIALRRMGCDLQQLNGRTKPKIHFDVLNKNHMCLQNGDHKQKNMTLTPSTSSKDSRPMNSLPSIEISNNSHNIRPKVNISEVNKTNLSVEKKGLSAGQPPKISCETNFQTDHNKQIIPVDDFKEMNKNNFKNHSTANNKMSKDYNFNFSKPESSERKVSITKLPDNIQIPNTSLCNSYHQQSSNGKQLSNVNEETNDLLKYSQYLFPNNKKENFIPSTNQSSRNISTNENRRNCNRATKKSDDGHVFNMAAMMAENKKNKLQAESIEDLPEWCKKINNSSKTNGFNKVSAISEDFHTKRDTVRDNINCNKTERTMMNGTAQNGSAKSSYNNADKQQLPPEKNGVWKTLRRSIVGGEMLLGQREGKDVKLAEEQKPTAVPASPVRRKLIRERIKFFSRN